MNSLLNCDFDVMQVTAKRPAQKGKATQHLPVKGKTSLKSVPPAATSTPKKDYLAYTPTKVSQPKKKPLPAEKAISALEQGASEAIESFTSKMGQITDVILSSQAQHKISTHTPTPSIDDSFDAQYGDWLKVLGSKVRRFDREDIDDFCQEVDILAYQYLKKAKARAAPKN